MKKLVLTSVFLAIVVIVLGAYTRLSDAGLGCPDWPGCYGNLVVPSQPDKVNAAEQAFPERPLEAFKAWVEMVHRYFAGLLGLLILAIAVVSVRKRFAGFESVHSPVKLPLLILVLVIGQAALGMWTVTMNLMPVVVMGHLLGGFTILSLLFLLLLRLRNSTHASPTFYRQDILAKGFGKLAAFAIVVLVTQIALGGWTSANYAALACTQLPVCEGEWVSRLDFADAFSVPEADNYEYGKHGYEGRMTIHITHRIGAIITFLYLGWLALTLYRKAASNAVKHISAVVLAVLTVQVLLGISNVVYKLPIVVAVLHNAVAAILLLSLVALNYNLFRKT